MMVAISSNTFELSQRNSSGPKLRRHQGLNHLGARICDVVPPHPVALRCKNRSGLFAARSCVISGGLLHYKRWG